MADDVRRWLEGLGLGECADAFEENLVDADVLPTLTSEDLKDLGVQAVGVRRKLLNAIARLNAGDGASDGAGSSTLPDHSPTAAERRQLTVMFCDLVGSTQLSRQLDPEDLREVMRSYQDAVAGAVTRYGGHIAKYLGDGVLVYFGWPQAYEDQAERAVRAGLDVVNAVNKVRLADAGKLSSRIGISSGQVVVGDLAGEADAITGETPNLAARLQGVAEPGAVVVGEATKALLGQNFAFDDLGRHDLKGFEKAVPAWRVVAATMAESRFEAKHIGRLLPLVGREAEMALLLDRWNLARKGKGQVVLLSGEAGVGKSRMVQALRDTLSDWAHFRLRYQCSPLFSNSAFYPVVQRLERAAHITGDDDNNAQLDKLEALLEISGGNNRADAPLFAKLMSLAGSERYGALNLSPQELREQAVDAMIRQVLDLSRRRPVFFLLEDAHWVDNSTETLIGEIMSRIKGVPVTMVITYRPDEYTPPWPELPYSSAIDLKRLHGREGGEIIRNIGGSDLPDNVVEQILDRAEGIPLFVEELTKSLLERRGDDIPVSLQASLMARLDQLGEAKEVAQNGAAVGREFTYDIIDKLMGEREAELPSLLDRLVNSELVYEVGSGRLRKYVFKHALIQDAAYGSMLHARRRELHGQIAQTLRDKSLESGVQLPEVVARHLSASGDNLAAAEQWRLAGQRATLLSAMEEAESCYQSGLDQIASLTRSIDIDRLTFDLRLALASLYFWKEGPKSIAAEKAYLLARELSKVFDDVERQNAVSWGLWGLYWNRGDTKKGGPYAYEQLARLDANSHPFAKSVAHRSVAVSEMTLGNFEAAASHANKACQEIVPNDDGQSATRFGHDLNVSAHMMLSLARGFLGDTDGAVDLAVDALSMARQRGHSATIGYTTYFIGLLQLQSRRIIISAPEIKEIERSVEQIPLLTDNWPEILGGMKVLAGQYDEAITLMSPRLQDPEGILHPTNVLYGDIAFRAAYAEALLGTDRRTDAAKVMQEAFQSIDNTGFAWWSAECFRVRGDIERYAGNSDEAASHYQEALDIAESQHAWLFYLRTAVVYAQLCADQGGRNQAQNLLQTAIDRTPSGAKSPDLNKAMAFSDELA